MEFMAAIGFGALFIGSLWLMSENEAVKDVCKSHPVVSLIVWFVVMTFIASFSFN